MRFTKDEAEVRTKTLSFVPLRYIRSFDLVSEAVCVLMSKRRSMETKRSHLSQLAISGQILVISARLNIFWNFCAVWPLGIAPTLDVPVLFQFRKISASLSYNVDEHVECWKTVYFEKLINSALLQFTHQKKKKTLYLKCDVISKYCPLLYIIYENLFDFSELEKTIFSVEPALPVVFEVKNPLEFLTILFH